MFNAAKVTSGCKRHPGNVCLYSKSGKVGTVKDDV